MARDCYKRQQGTQPIPVKQLNTDLDSPAPSNLKSALIQFQQFPTYVKRKLEGTNYHETEDASSSIQDDESNLNTDATVDTLTVADEGSDHGTWGTKTDTTNQDTQHTWGDVSKKQTRHNSPDLNAYRSGQCTYCDCSLGSKRMHGPLICHECRISLKEDAAHEKEQQAYEDRRQERYKKQLEGDTEVTPNEKRNQQQTKTTPTTDTPTKLSRRHRPHANYLNSSHA